MTLRERKVIERWVNSNYDSLHVWANNISKGDELAADLAHYALQQLLDYKQLPKLIHQESQVEGSIRGWVLATMRNSWHGSKSHFTRYYKLHRADIGYRKRWISPERFTDMLDTHQTEEYDYHKDQQIEQILELLDQMEKSNTRLWYISKLFKMWMDTPNFSKLSRQTGIPRTSIAKAVEECREYILQQLNDRNYDV